MLRVYGAPAHQRIPRGRGCSDGTSFLAAWEGRDLEPPELHESIRELVAELRASRASQDAATAALMDALGELARKGDPSVSGTSTSSDGKR